MESVGLCIQPYDCSVQTIYEGGVIGLPKVPSSMIGTVPIKYTPRIEDEVARDEIDMDGFKMFSPIMWTV